MGEDCEVPEQDSEAKGDQESGPSASGDENGLQTIYWVYFPTTPFFFKIYQRLKHLANNNLDGKTVQINRLTFKPSFHL